MRRVVVTGMGLLTSLGNNLDSSWDNLINFKSGIKKIDHFDVSNLPSKIAGFINNDPNDEDYVWPPSSGWSDVVTPKKESLELVLDKEPETPKEKPSFWEGDDPRDESPGNQSPVYERNSWEDD